MRMVVAGVVLLAGCSGGGVPGEVVTVTSTAYLPVYETLTMSPAPTATVFKTKTVVETETVRETVTARPDPETTVGPGMYVVGDDVEPGRYRSEDGSGCYADVEDGEDNYLAQELGFDGPIIIDVPDAPGAVLEVRACTLGKID